MKPFEDVECFSEVPPSHVSSDSEEFPILENSQEGNHDFIGFIFKRIKCGISHLDLDYL